MMTVEHLMGVNLTSKPCKCNLKEEVSREYGKITTDVYITECEDGNSISFPSGYIHFTGSSLYKSDNIGVFRCNSIVVYNNIVYLIDDGKITELDEKYSDITESEEYVYLSVKYKKK